jgi:hypothetical protein
MVVCPFIIYLFVIVLSVVLRFMDSDYPSGIFNLFFQQMMGHRRDSKADQALITRR